MRPITCYPKFLNATLFIIILFYGQIIHAQTIMVSAPPNYPPAKNIGPGTTDNIIGMFQTYTEQATSLTSVTLPTSGTYSNTDFIGFKLWYRNSYTSDNPINGATLIGQTGPISNGATLVFTGLNVSLEANNTGFFYTTTDVSSSATVSHNIQLTQTPVSNFVFSSGTTTGGNDVQAMAIQTIGTPLPVVAIQGMASSDQNISGGSSGLTLYGFEITVNYSDATFTSLTVPTTGTYLTSDIVSNGFKLWYSLNGSHELIQAASVVSSGNDLVFSGFNKQLGKDLTHYLFITVDLSPAANLGHTLGLTGFPLSNFNFTQLQSLTGQDPFMDGGIFTVAVPTISLSSSTVNASSVSPGSYNNILYKLIISSQNSSAAFSQVKFSTSGTYQTSDISAKGFKIYRGDATNFNSGELIASVDPVVSGGTMVFNMASTTVNENDQMYLYLTVDISSSANAGSTISIKPFSASSLTPYSGGVTGSGSAGGVKTISIPSVAFTPSGPVAGSIAAGTYVALHTVQVSVTGAPVTFSSATYSTTGTYQSSDFNGADIYIIYHTTPNPVQEMFSSSSAFVISSADVLPNTGNSLTFNYKPLGIDANPTIPSGDGYISVIVKSSPSAVNGHTIQLSTGGLSAISFSSANVSGSIGDGGMQTIGSSVITASGVDIPNASIAPGTTKTVYSVQLNISNTSAILQSATFSTSGTYNTSDIAYYYLYGSDDANLDMTNDFNFGSAQSVASGSTISFPAVNNKELNVGTKYFFLVAVTSFGATLGNTFNIASVDPSNFVFVSGSATGSTMAAGGIQTFAAPSVINLSIPPVPGTQFQAGSYDNLIYQFTISPTGANAMLQSVKLTTTGTFTSTDLSDFNAFKLYYNTTNSFPGSTELANFYNINSGEDIKFNLIGTSIPDGATGYFYITTDIALSPVSQRTLGLGSFSNSNLTFSAGDATGSASATDLFTIVTPITGLTSSSSTTDFNLYPNPIKQGETLKMVTNIQGMKIVKVYNSLGDLIKTEEVMEDIINLDLVIKGLYWVSIEHPSTHAVISKPLLIE